MILSVSTVLASIVLSSLPGSALPVQVSRQASQPDGYDLKQIMNNVISEYLGSQKIEPRNFLAIQGGKQINWIGSTAQNVTQEAGNVIVYQTADSIPNWDGSGTESFFSDAYRIFIQDLGQKLNTDKEFQNENVKKAQEEQTKKCGKELSDVKKSGANEFITNYQTFHPDKTPSPEAILKYINQDYAPYKSANADCIIAQERYSAAFDKSNGPNFALFAQASANMRPLADALPHVVEGITMPADSAAADTTGDEGGMKDGVGNVLPLYDLTSLEAILEGWQARPDDAEKEWERTSEQETSHEDKESHEGSASVGIQWGRVGGHVGASHSDSSETSDHSVQSYKVTFDGLTLVDVETGLWFDDYRTAKQCETPHDESDISIKAQQAFKEHFGTPERPKAAAHRNKQALIAYRPSYEFTFKDEASAKKFTEDKFDMSANYLVFDVNASGGKMSEHLDTSAASNVVRYKPSSKNGIILGYVVEKYWPQGVDKTDFPDEPAVIHNSSVTSSAPTSTASTGSTSATEITSSASNRVTSSATSKARISSSDMSTASSTTSTAAESEETGDEETVN